MGHRHFGLIFLLTLSQSHRGACIHLRQSKALIQCSKSLTILLTCLFHKVVSHCEKSPWPMAAFLKKCVVLTEDGSRFRTTTATKCYWCHCKSLYSHLSVYRTRLCVRGETRKYNVCLHWPGVMALPTWGSDSFQQSWDQVESSAWPLQPPNPPAQGSSGTGKHAIKTPVWMERVCLKN